MYIRQFLCQFFWTTLQNGRRFFNFSKLKSFPKLPFLCLSLGKIIKKFKEINEVTNYLVCIDIDLHNFFKPHVQKPVILVKGTVTDPVESSDDYARMVNARRSRYIDLIRTVTSCRLKANSGENSLTTRCKLRYHSWNYVPEWFLANYFDKTFERF